MSIFVDLDARGLKTQSRVIKQCAYEARNEVSCEVSQYLDSWVSELIEGKYQRLEFKKALCSQE
jgi:hypothetical protein